MNRLFSTLLLAFVTMAALAQSKIGTLAETYWRNEQTGDWDIGFTERYAIYDCRLWDYSDVKQKGDKFEVTLTANGDQVNVTIGKLKDGKRQMTIVSSSKNQVSGGKKQTYSQITTGELPNYPAKDLTPFKDNRYQAGDTVTLAGWLKDFPQQVLDRNRKYEIKIYSIITREEQTYSGDIDDEGHFVVKVPVENSEQVWIDWQRSRLLSVFEPGETYFLLLDVKNRQRLMMGRNARFQNELMAHDYRKEFCQPDDHNLTEEQLLAYKDQWLSMYQHNQAKLDSVLQQNPTLSRRFEDYHRMEDVCTTAEELLQGRFFIGGRKLPQVVKDCVDSLLWSRVVKPYTLTRYMGWLLFYYSLYVEEHSGKINKARSLDADMMFQMEKDGNITYTDADHEFLNRWKNLVNQYKQAKPEDFAAIDEENKDLIAQVNEFFGRPDIDQLVRDYLDAIPTEAEIADSTYADPDLRDFIKAQKLYERIDNKRQPLRKRAMAVLNQIQLPAVRNAILAESNKYAELLKADVADSDCLRPSSDVEGLTDGEAILRKILEPFKGRIVYLDIWGTWCSPCKDKLKESHFVKEQLKNYDIVYLYLANRSPEESWKNIIKEYNLTGPNCVHYNLPKEQQHAVEQFLNVDGFPTYRLIDKQGNIHYLHWTHADDMPSFLETIDKLSK